MKRIVILLVIVGICHSYTFSQKKYEMVVEKTDGTETVFNVEDVVRTYFRERSDGTGDEEANFFVGEWQECDSYGNLRNDNTDIEVTHFNFHSDGTADLWAVTRGKVVDYTKYSMNYSYTYSGNSGTMSWTITSSPDQTDIGQKYKVPFTYENDILLLGNVYLKRINNGGQGGETPYHIGEAVDLGLSVKWASCNVGANSPEETGGYYAWGEIEEKDKYYDYNYQYCDSESSYHDIGTNISGTQYDVARVKWGGAWRMPTTDEFNEMVKKCTLTWTSVNGMNGIRVTGPNGNSIFMAAGGRKYANSGLRDFGEYGCYWTSTIESNKDGYSPTARMFLFYNRGTDTNDGRNRINGMPVRPVTSDASGIRIIENDLNDSKTYYNMSGQRLEKPRKGINFIENKKIVIK